MEDYVSQIHHVKGFMNADDAARIYNHAKKFSNDFTIRQAKCRYIAIHLKIEPINDHTLFAHFTNSKTMQ